jgi:hypothetical protein
VRAAPIGLNQIPIAKVHGDGGVALSLAQTDIGAPATVVTTQFGRFNIAEVGLDYLAVPSDQQTFLANAKLLWLHKPGNVPDIVRGILNVATGQRTVPYLVATTQPRSLGISIGVIRPASNGYEGMAGLSYNVSANAQIVADIIRGWSN